MGRTAKLVLGSAAEWVLLLALWMGFVSQTKKDELLVGIAVAAIGTFADFVVKRENFAKFKPKPSWLMWGLTLPWYAAKGCAATLKAFCAKLAGHPPDSVFKVSGYDANGPDDRSAAKRALAVAFLTIPPNSIIVGIDTERKQVLTHQIVPSSPTILEKKLGVHP